MTVAGQLDPLEKTVSNQRRTLPDLKSLLEDRGYKRNVYKDVGRDKCKSFVSVRYNKVRWCLSRFRAVLVICFLLALARICGARSSGE